MHKKKHTSENYIIMNTHGSLPLNAPETKNVSPIKPLKHGNSAHWKTVSTDYKQSWNVFFRHLTQILC